MGFVDETITLKQKDEMQKVILQALSRDRPATVQSHEDWLGDLLVAWAGLQKELTDLRKYIVRNFPMMCGQPAKDDKQ